MGPDRFFSGEPIGRQERDCVEYNGLVGRCKGKGALRKDGESVLAWCFCHSRKGRLHSIEESTLLLEGQHKREPGEASVGKQDTAFSVSSPSGQEENILLEIILFGRETSASENG